MGCGAGGGSSAVSVGTDGPIQLLPKGGKEGLTRDSDKLDPGMGLRFLDLPAADADAIDRWIAETARRERLLR